MLVLDVSGSMTGDPIDELNRGVKQFVDEVSADDFASNAIELGVITFGGVVLEPVSMVPLHQVEIQAFSAGGQTPMGEAVTRAIQTLDDRKRDYKNAGVSYYQPWLVLMTDGAPTDSYEAAAARLKHIAEQKKVLVFGIGIGDYCDFEVLSKFCPSERPPKRLAGLKFVEFFAWLSDSMKRVSTSTPGTEIALSSTGGWETIGI
ncbi:MAG: VWA domain-containing protein [bacterium]|nr:VWA domain-containing protein [bacterium]